MTSANGDVTGFFPGSFLYSNMTSTCSYIITFTFILFKFIASAHHYETIKDRDIIYSHGNPSELTSFNWYHGTITREQADAALSMGRDNEFLIWQSTNNLVLSMRINGWASHNMIQRSSSGYCLNRKSRGFRSVPEMVAHYQQFPICESTQQVLATACRKLLPTGAY